ncbi:MAG: stage V sporulation protein AD, partial [Lachnospiraceae bacterium]
MQNSAMQGTQSIQLRHPVYVRESASIVGTKEGEGPLGNLFDMVGSNDLFGCETWEDAESSLQREAVYLALKKAQMKDTEIRYLFAGDLLGQSIATSFGLMNYKIPLLGLYGACSTCGEALCMGAMAIDGGYADHVMCVTSSHYASAEKEFRFPLEYGSQRPLSASWTVTGSGAFILSSNAYLHASMHVKAKITGLTIGRIVDYGLKDSMNMGACMAPAAEDTIYHHLQDFNRTPKDYDRIITGDLGQIGQSALLTLLRDRKIEIAQQHMDCGIKIFDPTSQDTHAGGSGCGCAATVLSAYILKQIEEGIWKRVLFVPTGALLSKTSFNEGQTVPG